MSNIGVGAERLREHEKYASAKVIHKGTRFFRNDGGGDGDGGEADQKEWSMPS